jgi:hypothetical protein
MRPINSCNLIERNFFMTSTIYQRFTYWFAPLLFSVFVLSYQNCSDVGFQRIGGDEGPGGEGLACLPNNFDLQMSTTIVTLNNPVTFSATPAAAETTYTWELNNLLVGTGPINTQTFTTDGTYSMKVTALKAGCENPRSKTVSFTIESAPVCNLNALALTGDSWGRVNEMLDYIVNHNCLDLIFGWNAGDGSVVTNTNNEMQHAWTRAGLFVVSTDVNNGVAQKRLSMPVTIQDACPALGDLFVSAPDVAFVNSIVPFDIIIPGCLNIASISWSFGSDSNPPTSSVKQTQTTYASPGVRNVSVIVTDNEGNSASLPHRITILSSTLPPCDEEALLTLTGPTVGNVNESLRFGVYVPECMQATAFSWNFGDSTGGSGNPANKSYSTAGTYTISVIVSTVEHGFITLSRRVIIRDVLTYTWQYGSYGPCTGPCGANAGSQTRFSQCISSTGQIVADTFCTAPKPAPQSISCTVPANSCTCTPPLVNVGGECVSTLNGLCAVAPPGILSVENAAALPALCNPGNSNPSSIIVAAGQIVTYSCVGSGNGTTQSNCRVTRCNANQTVQGGSCVTTQTYSWLESWSVCAGACGQNQGSQTSSYTCVNSNGGQVADNLCPQPKPNSQTRSCTVASNSCTCTPPQVNVGGVCITPVNGACLNPNPYTIAFDANILNINPRCGAGTAVNFPASVAIGSLSPTYRCDSTNNGTNATDCRIQRCGVDQYVSGNASCITCPVGQVPNAARNGCTPCGANQIENPAGTCSTCPNGQINNGSNVCVPVVTYSWQFGSYGACSGACGTNAGTQTRFAECRNNSGQLVADSFCTAPKPAPQTQACTVRQCNSCTLDGQTVAHGGSRNFFSASSVACGQTCQSQLRTCTDGVLSGNSIYSNANCSVGICNSCTLNGVTVAHGSSRNFFNSSSVACDQTCDAQPRTCNNGILSGNNSYSQPFCSVAPCNYTYQWNISDWGACSATQCGTSGTRNRSVTCLRNDGVTVSDNTCLSSGAGAKPVSSEACSARACYSCNQDGVTVAHGTTRSFFSSNSVACGQTCQSQPRTCNDGNLSGNSTYSNASCNTGTCNSCTLDGVTVAHGSSRDFFNSSAVACGQTCQSASRSCNNGVLSGSATYSSASCSVGACNYTWRLITTYAVFDDPFSIPAPMYCHPYNVYSLPGSFGQPPQTISAPPACNANNAEGWYFHTRSTVPGCGNSVSQGVVQDQYQCVVVP